MKEFTVKCDRPEDIHIAILQTIAEFLGGEGTVERIEKLGVCQHKIMELMDAHRHIPRSVVKEYNKIISELYPKGHE